MVSRSDPLNLVYGRPSPPAPPRQANPAQEQKLGERFAERLSAQSKSLAEAEAMPKRSGDFVQAIAGRHSRHGGGARNQDRDNDPDGSATVMTTPGTEARQSITAPGELGPPAKADPNEAMIERMAAAVAELQSSQLSHSIRIEFPSGSAVAESALLTRDAQSGAFSVRITGMVTGTKERRRVEMEDELRLGLQRRHIRATVQIDDAPAGTNREPGLGRPVRLG